MTESRRSRQIRDRTTTGTSSSWAVCVRRIFSEYLALKRAYADERERESSLLAWRARNLLELSAWCLYCAKDRPHARRLYEDAGRDVLGIYSGFEKWGTAAKEADFLALFSTARRELSSRAAVLDQYRNGDMLGPSDSNTVV
jgi:hypothetical protein